MFAAKRTGASGHGKTYEDAAARTAKKGKLPIREARSQVCLKNYELVLPRRNGRVGSGFLLMQIKGEHAHEDLFGNVCTVNLPDELQLRTTF